MMGNLAGWIHETMMHEVCGILTWKNSPSNEQRCKSEALFTWSKALHLFSLVPCAFASPLDQGALCWSYVRCSLCFFSFLQKVSGQQILERCIKDIVFRFVVHIHALKKIQIQKIHLAWIPKCLPTLYFIIIFLREIPLFEKVLFLVFTNFFCLLSLSRSRLWENCMNINKGAFW